MVAGSGTEQGSTLAQQLFIDLAKTMLANTAAVQGLASEVRLLRDELRSFGSEGFKEVPEILAATVEGVEAIGATQNVMLTILQQVAERGAEVNKVTWADVADIMTQIKDQMDGAEGADASASDGGEQGEPDANR
jgi:hypothetical protein